MNKHEQIARELKKNNTCSYALYKAFEGDYKLDEDYPKPRSIDGKCGALLTTEYILKKLNKEKYIKEYEEYFEKEFGYTKCIDLMRHEKRCNDYVGISAKLLDEYLSKE